MLGRIDRTFAALTWLIAAVLVVMLLFGPAVVAHDKVKGGTAGSPYAGSAPDGEALFVNYCGSCHTLSRAGTTGEVGPNLDKVSLTPAQVAAQVRHGGGSMPAFAGQLNNSQITAVAEFVAKTR